MKVEDKSLCQAHKKANRTETACTLLIRSQAFILHHHLTNGFHLVLMPPARVCQHRDKWLLSALELYCVHKIYMKFS